MTIHDFWLSFGFLFLGLAIGCVLGALTPVPDDRPDRDLP